MPVPLALPGGTALDEKQGFDNSMLRIGSKGMQLHSVANPAVEYRDALVQGHVRDPES